MKQVNMKSRIIAPVVAAAFVIGIGLSMAFNLWHTESSRIPVTYTEGEFKGAYNPADIRGSYTFADIESAFGIPAEVLAEAYGIRGEEDPAGFPVKELEQMYGQTPDGGEIGTDSVRLFVARYNGLPYTPEPSSRLPYPALQLLQERVSPDELDSLKAVAVQMSQIRIIETDTSADENHDEDQDTEEMVVTGKTTFDELLNWGLTQEEIEEVLGLPMGMRSTSVRDFVIAEGMEFSHYKTGLQELLDAKFSE